MRWESPRDRTPLQGDEGFTGETGPTVLRGNLEDLHLFEVLCHEDKHCEGPKTLFILILFPRLDMSPGLGLLEND